MQTVPYFKSTQPPHGGIQKLYLLYDARCGLCVGIKKWLSRQQLHVPLIPLPQQSALVRKRWPELSLRCDAQGNPQDMVVISDRGEVWRGNHGYLIVLWATRRYRNLSLLLVRRKMVGLAGRIYALLSSNRYRVCRLLGLKGEDIMRAARGAEGDAAIWEARQCRVPQSHGVSDTLQEMQQGEWRIK